MSRMTTPTSTSLDRLPDRTRAYVDAVVAGETVAGPYVRGACLRHLKDLEDGHERGLRFNVEAAHRKIEFFERILKLSEGQFEGQPFLLHASQAFIVGSLFGWERWDEEAQEWRRRFHSAYIEQGKGNGKSPLAGGIGLIGLCADDEAGAEVYAAAANKDQARVLFRDAVKMVKAAPKLSKRLKLSGGDGKEFNIAHLASGSFFRPTSKEVGKTGSGPRPHFVLVDEIHELPSRAVLETLERGFKFRRNPLKLMTTNSGSDRNSVCWEEHLHAIRVALGNVAAETDPTFIGEPIDDRTFAFVCALDEGDDPLENPECWVKANPLLGVTISRGYLADQVKQAKSIPGKLNGILRLHFCVWTDAETAWMTREALEPCVADFDPAEHEGKAAFVGADLSQNRDITALAYVVKAGTVPDGEHKGKPLFDCWTECFTPADTLAARALRDGLPYEEWVRSGQLTPVPGQSISYRHVAQALAEVAHGYNVQCVAYDRYAFKRGFEPECAELGLDLEFVEHPQGGTRRGKPTEAMKEVAHYNRLNGLKDTEAEGLWMPGSIRALEELILEGRIRFRRNAVLITAMMSAVPEHDRWDNYWLAKQRSSNKIDAAVAVAMAVGAAMALDVRTAPASPWDDPAFSLAEMMA